MGGTVNCPLNIYRYNVLSAVNNIFLVNQIEKLLHYPRKRLFCEIPMDWIYIYICKILTECWPVLDVVLVRLPRCNPTRVLWIIYLVSDTLNLFRLHCQWPMSIWFTVFRIRIGFSFFLNLISKTECLHNILICMYRCIQHINYVQFSISTTRIYWWFKSG